MPAGDDPEDLDPGLARQRTQLAWTRTAISFAALGVAILKVDIVAGLIVAGSSLVIWALSRAAVGGVASWPRSRQLLLVTITVVAVSLVALVVALTVHGRSAT
jgi:uncharacterized membrane protein YidH (DUF202 family)